MVLKFAERRIVSSSSDYLPPRCPGSTEWVPERKEENEKSIANVELFSKICVEVTKMG